MKNKPQTKLFGWGIVVLGVLIAGCSSEQGRYDSFAQCLTEKGAIMYGVDWCSHCQNQKRLFGDSFKYINYVNCEQHKKDCLRAGVEGYPTWKINKTSYSGEQSLERLASLTGCKLEG